MFKNLQIYKSWSQAIASRNMAQIVNIALVGVVLLLALKALFQKPIIIVTPPGFTQEFTMQGDRASQGYKISWANYVANTIGNTNPRNIDFNREVIVTMLSPNLQDALGNKLKRASEIMKTRKMTQNFTLQDAVYDPKNDIVYIWGRKIIKVARQEPISANWTYEVQIKSRQGMPRITYLKQYSGTPKAIDLKSKNSKKTPEYLSPAIRDAIEGNTFDIVEDSLGHEPDIKPQHEDTQEQK